MTFISNMATLGQIALQKEHLRLMETLEPKYIADYLYTKGVLSPESLEYVTDENRCCRDRCRHLLLALGKKSYSLAPFLHALIYDDNFPFLCTELLITLGELMSDTNVQIKPKIQEAKDDRFTLAGLCNPSREIKRTIFTKEHFAATKLYCKLRRLLNQGKNVIHEFDTEADKYHRMWELHKDDSCKRHLVANRYFEVKILQLRKLSEGGATDEAVQEIFSEIAQLVPYTSHPSASITSLLTLYAHALLTARKPGEEVLNVLNEAKSNFPFLPGCRETSLALITEFKVYWQMYEKSSEKVSKDELLKKAAAAAMHFASDLELAEDPIYQLYINRGLQFLQTLANLGLGYTLRHVVHDHVTKENIHNAKTFLKTVDTGEGWQQMELRWRMSYYVANAKIHFVEENFHKALQLAKKAKDLSDSVHFKEENENITDFINLISLNIPKILPCEHEDRTYSECENECRPDTATNHENISAVSSSEHMSPNNGSPHSVPEAVDSHIYQNCMSHQVNSSNILGQSIQTNHSDRFHSSSSSYWYSPHMVLSSVIIIVLLVLQYLFSVLRNWLFS